MKRRSLCKELHEWVIFSRSFIDSLVKFKYSQTGNNMRIRITNKFARNLIMFTIS